MSSAELKVVRKWLDDQLAKGFIRPFHTRCVAPLLLTAKPGEGVRICQDYRGLNNITIKSHYQFVIALISMLRVYRGTRALA
jgi:hypothetical protein